MSVQMLIPFQNHLKNKKNKRQAIPTFFFTFKFLERPPFRIVMVSSKLFTNVSQIVSFIYLQVVVISHKY